METRTRRTLRTLLVPAALALMAAGGCARTAPGDPAGATTPLGSAIFRQIGSSSGCSPTYNPATGKLAFVRKVGANGSGANWLYAVRRGRETRLFRGESPSYSRAGLYYQDGNDGLRLLQAGTDITVSVFSMPEGIRAFASPSGDKVVMTLLYITEMQVLDVKKGYTQEMRPPRGETAVDISWVSENELLMSTVREGKIGAGGTYLVKLGKFSKPSNPKRLLRGYESAALSPDGRTLACVAEHSLGRSNRLAAFEFPGLKKMGTATPSSATSCFYGSIAWLSNARLVVSEWATRKGEGRQKLVTLELVAKR